MVTSTQVIQRLACEFPPSCSTKYSSDTAANLLLVCILVHTLWDSLYLLQCSAVMDILRKHQLEVSLHEEQMLIENGRLKEDSPLDLSESFEKLCEACRKGDLKSCQELLTEGVNINARDQFDYTPLILVTACSHNPYPSFPLTSGG